MVCNAVRNVQFTVILAMDKLSNSGTMEQGLYSRYHLEGADEWAVTMAREHPQAMR